MFKTLAASVILDPEQSEGDKIWKRQPLDSIAPLEELQNDRVA